MKRTFCSIILAALTAIAVPSSSAAEPDQLQTDSKTLALIKDLEQQQALIADNQTKIDEKLALVAEAVRLARIYSSRTGR